MKRLHEIVGFLFHQWILIRRTRLVFLLALSVACRAQAAFFQGEIDPTFQPEAYNSGVGSLLPNDQLVLASTQLRVGGYRNEIRILTRNGALAQRPVTLSAFKNITSVVAAEDGSFLCYGEPAEGSQKGILRRVRSDLTLDSQFAPEFQSGFLPLNAMLPLPDGRVLVGGKSGGVIGNNAVKDLVSLLPNGKVDTTWLWPGGGGTVNAIAKGPAGSFYVGGTFTNVGNVPRAGLARILSSGALDPSFVSGPFGGPVIAGIHSMQDGRIVTLCSLPDLSASAKYINRLLADGSFDPEFTSPDAVPAPNGYSSLAVDRDGRIVWALSGGIRAPGGGTKKLVSFTSTGQQDTSFDPFLVTYTAEAPKVQVNTLGEFYVFGTSDWDGIATSAGVVRLRGAPAEDIAPRIFTPMPAKPNVIKEGGASLYTVRATGYPSPTIQWLQNGRVLQGETNITFSIPMANPTNSGVYSIIASNRAGTVTQEVYWISTAPASRAPGSTEPGRDILAAKGEWFLTAMELEDQSLILAVGISNKTSVQIELRKYKPDTKRDTGFAATLGIAPLNLFAPLTLRSLPAGQILVGGAFTNVNGSAMRSLARLQSTGALETEFRSPAVDSKPINKLRILEDGRILVVSEFLQFENATRAGVAILLSDGRLDETFIPPAELNGSRTLDALAWNGGYAIAQWASFGDVLPWGPIFLDTEGKFVPGRLAIPESPYDTAMTTLPDGTLVAVGRNRNAPSRDQPFWYHFQADGTLAPDSGQAFTAAFLPLYLWTDPQGRLLAFYRSMLQWRKGDPLPVLLRLDKNGTLLSDFILYSKTFPSADFSLSGLREVMYTRRGTYGLVHVGVYRSIFTGDQANLPPRILNEPSDFSTAPDRIASLAAEVSGEGVGYQWFTQSGIYSSTNALFQIPTFTGYRAVGPYYFVATNAFGSVTSKLAMIRPRLPDPTTNAYPLSAFTVVAGTSFTGQATETGLRPARYTWFHNGRPIATLQGPQLYINSVKPEHAGFYQTLVTDSAGERPAGRFTLRVNTPLSFSGLQNNPSVLAVCDDCAMLPGSSSPEEQTVALTPLLDVQLRALTLFLTGPGTVSWEWNRGSTPPQTAIYARVASTQVVTNLTAATPSWTPASIEIPAGNQLLAFRVLQSAWPPNGIAYLRGFKFVPSSFPPPSLENDQISISVQVGDPVTLRSKVDSSTPLNYRWSKNGVSLELPSSPALELPSATPDDAGLYTVVADNGHGSPAIQTIQLTVFSNPSGLVFTPPKPGGGTSEIALFGAFKLDLERTPQFRPQTSMDLVHWKDLPCDVKSTFESIQLRFWDAGDSPQQFYRVLFP